MSEWKTLKEYIPIAVHWDCEGDLDYSGEVVPYLTPTCLHLEGGGVYRVDRVRADGVLPSFYSGGYGRRYAARVSCDAEDSYDKVYYLYYESHGKLGRWRCGEDYVAANVFWGADGKIIPTAFYLDDHRYLIDQRSLTAYRMSTRKSDGAGMRYIFRATCDFLRDYGREFSLMLEHGGKLAGRWYCEDGEVVHGKKIALHELSDGAFDKRLVEEEMGVSHVCAQFAPVAEAAALLRKWNTESGIWPTTEIFDQKIGEMIYPGCYYPVMLAGEGGVAAAVMQWGLARAWASGSIYNLRLDNLMAKSTFGAIKNNRCAIACSGFYVHEKDGKTVAGDHLLSAAGGGATYLAGLYEQTKQGGRFTLITTQAGVTVAGIHDRMPVILSRGDVKSWLAGKLPLSEIGRPHDLSQTQKVV
ncbi:MAG: SOS response-associated peptidase [Oscillospiraceae bacterium]|nr:SOS response-associated peptidase [Oscillospiraceae bacterium]